MCLCSETYDKLVAAGTLVPAADKPVPPVPQDLAAAVSQGKVGRQGGGAASQQPPACP